MLLGRCSTGRRCPRKLVDKPGHSRATNASHPSSPSIPSVTNPPELPKNRVASPDVEDREKRELWRAVLGDIAAHWRTDVLAALFAVGFVYSLFFAESVAFAIITAIGAMVCGMWARAGAVWGRLPLGGLLGAKKRGEQLPAPDAPDELATQPQPGDESDAENRPP
jgi:hypothetical protein